MTRTCQLLAILVACTASAFAIAQSQEAEMPADADAAQPQEEAPAPEAADPPVAEADDDYVDLRRARPITGNAAAGQEKSEVCVACHGPQGVSVVPAFPNLAGQHADFMYWQMVEFKRNPDSPMSPLVADLSDEDMRDLSVYYANLAPTPADAESAETPPDPVLLQRGEQLYLAGDPAKGIPPCQGCHGAEARGHGDALRADSSGHTPYAAWPTLRGQQGMYLQTKLAEYRDGKMDDSTTDFVMTGIGRRLDDESIEALAAWLSSLPPSR